MAVSPDSAPLSIAAMRLHRIQIPLKRSFSHALSDRAQTDAVLVELIDAQGASGWGEILPRPYVTGEDVPTVLERTAPDLATAVLGQTFADVASVLQCLRTTLRDCSGALATMAGIELATLDLAGNRLGFAAADCLGEFRGPELPAGVIIGFDTRTEKLARYCAVLRLSGKKFVKVKVGLADDVQRCALVTKVFGPKVPLRIDANAAWSPKEAVQALADIAAVAPLHSVEQPVAKDDIEGLAYVRREGGVPVMADESVCSMEDADRLIAADAVDIFNVRPGKHGGLLASVALCQRAREAGVRIHLGTLVGETGILSRAAELLGRCVPGLDCLDGKGQNAWLLQQDVLGHPTHGPDAPAIDAPGLGIKVQEDRVAQFRLLPPTTFSA